MRKVNERKKKGRNNESIDDGQVTMGTYTYQYGRKNAILSFKNYEKVKGKPFLCVFGGVWGLILLTVL